MRRLKHRRAHRIFTGPRIDHQVVIGETVHPTLTLVGNPHRARHTLDDPHGRHGPHRLHRKLTAKVPPRKKLTHYNGVPFLNLTATNDRHEGRARQVAYALRLLQKVTAVRAVRHTRVRQHLNRIAELWSHEIRGTQVPYTTNRTDDLLYAVAFEDRIAYPKGQRTIDIGGRCSHQTR